MASPNGPLWGCVLALGALAACEADERGLSFEVGVVSSAGKSTGGSNGSSAGKANNEGGQDAAAGENAGPDGAGQPAGGMPSNQAGSNAGDSGSANAGTAGTSAGTSTGGESGSGSGGISSGGGGASSGTGGMAGTAGDPFDSPCGDLDVNLVDDCEETLVKNSRFDSALAEWTADGALVTQKWDAMDARSKPGSGSISVINGNVVAGGTGNTTLGSGQCVVAWGNERFDVGARAFIKEGQGGRASLNVLVFGHDGCQGTLLDGLTVGSVSTPGSWRVINGTVKMPAAARSALVRLVATKPFAQTSLEVLFDDVLVREQ